MTSKFNLLLLSIFFIFNYQVSSWGQSYLSSNSEIELQGAIGLVQLINGTKGLKYFSIYDISEINFGPGSFSGYNLQLGLLGNLKINATSGFRSGIQLQFLNGKKESYREDWLLVAPFSLLEEADWTNQVRFIGFQIPVIFESRRSFGSWSAYTNFGFSLSYSLIKSKAKKNRNYYFDYGLNVNFNDSCSCELINVVNVPESERFNTSEEKESFNQFQLGGILGIGAIFNKGNRNFRLGYRLTADIIPLKQGNFRFRDNVYDLYGFEEINHHHLVHQLEFSILLPKNKLFSIGEEGYGQSQSRWLLGVGSNFQYLLVKSNSSSGRDGIGVGSSFSLMYLFDNNMGIRAETGFWFEPSSYDDATTFIFKAEFVYALPFESLLHVGVSHRVDKDFDPFVVKSKGVLLGGSKIVPLSSFLGIQFQLTGHYFLGKDPPERLMIEASLGVVASLGQ